jgi:hypothetical protein
MVLDPNKYEPRTHAALTYVRAFLTTEDGVPVEIEERFVSEFEPDERVHVMAAMKGMFCTNLLVNDWRWMSWKITCKPLGSACKIPEE